MQHMKTVVVYAAIKTVVDYTTCDFCPTKLGSGRFEVKRVTLEFEQGSSYPEGSMGTKTTVDCCADCWEDKVLPALRDLGAEPRETEWEQ